MTTLAMASRLSSITTPRVLVRFVADGGDVGEARDLFVDQFGDALDEHRAVDVVRNFRDDDLFAAALELLDADLARGL